MTAAAADALVEELAALQPNSGALPALRAQQAQTRTQDNGALDAELKQGADAFRAGRIVGPGDDTALASLQGRAGDRSRTTPMRVPDSAR